MITKIYISSPYTIGDTAINVKKSFMMFHLLRDMGYMPFTPLTSHFLHLEQPRHYEDWMDWDLYWMNHCDLMFRMPGESSGADREVHQFRKTKYLVFYSIETFWLWDVTNNSNQQITLESAVDRYSKIMDIKI